MPQIAKTENELIQMGKELSNKIDKGTIILLTGPLGSGKTTFTKGIAQGLNISQKITSPTYTISKEYEQKLCHIDAYRIGEEDLGIDEYLEQGYIVCIEWHQNLNLADRPNMIEVKIDYDPQGRKISILEQND